MYAKTLSSNSISEDGRTVYSQIQEVYKLDVVQHQAGESIAQHKFRDLLLRLHWNEILFQMPPVYYQNG